MTNVIYYSILSLPRNNGKKAPFWKEAMMKEKGYTELEEFEEVVKLCGDMIYHHIHRLGIRDPEGEFYQEGLIALWDAYRSYDYTRGKFTTYAYFIIQNRLKDLIRKKNREKELKEKYEQFVQQDPSQHTYYMEELDDDHLFQQIEKILTPNQLKWLTLHRLAGYSYKEISEMERVSVDAVKNWGRLAKAKLRRINLDDY
ncbi:sigma-70 family RNA polymerase sigma factor [Gracilibacillus dipsosauri]|uniref:sigma-70 family RNA polymerase sigma factor n=1 Tax=Gracilibacillus dipsosauri TaxID=178340 RepID=UPI00240A18CF